MATGGCARRGAHRPSGGSRPAGIRRVAVGRRALRRRRRKTWITNAARGPHRDAGDRSAGRARAPGSASCWSSPARWRISRDLPKLRLPGVESCELSFAGSRVPAGRARGEEGRGFAQFMPVSSSAGCRCRPSRRRRPGRVRRRTAYAAARDLRTADLAAPVGRQPARRHGHAGAGGAAAHARRRRQHRRGRRSDLEAGMVSCSPRRRACRSRSTRCASTGPPATRRGRRGALLPRCPADDRGEGTNEIQRGVIARQLSNGPASSDRPPTLVACSPVVSPTWRSCSSRRSRCSSNWSPPRRSWRAPRSPARPVAAWSRRP